MAGSRLFCLLRAGAALSQGSRVIAGYHWQSDVDASRLLSSACFARLQACEEYMKDLAAARAELAALPPVEVKR